MARGRKWSFGKRINDPRIFIPLMALFVVGLFDWRRPLSVRNLDVLMLASFAASLYFFNAGEIFWSVPLAYPPLLWLFGRLLWLGFGKGAQTGLRDALADLAGRRPRGVRARASGPASTCGARTSSTSATRASSAPTACCEARSPYGNMPQGTGKPCGTEVLRRHLRRLRADRRRLRVRRRPRRHVRPGHLLLVHADDRGARLERALGRPAGGARDVDPVRLPGRGRARAGRLEARRADAWPSRRCSCGRRSRSRSTR